MVKVGNTPENQTVYLSELFDLPHILSLVRYNSHTFSSYCVNEVNTNLNNVSFLGNITKTFIESVFPNHFLAKSWGSLSNIRYENECIFVASNQFFICVCSYPLTGWLHRYHTHPWRRASRTCGCPGIGRHRFRGTETC